MDDEVSIERNIELLRKECSKSKPKSEIIKELIRRTIKARREDILKGTRPDVVLEQYPHLRKATYVSIQEIPNWFLN